MKMATESLNDKYSIKNILFTKTIPNYVIPVPVTGHKIYPCIDCGDRFLLQSSLEYHINRKSMKITYLCRRCNQLNIFFNRCSLLAHIRSHALKTATINVGDLKVEVLPLDYFQSLCKKNTKHDNILTSLFGGMNKNIQNTHLSKCFECHLSITESATSNEGLVKHLMQHKDQTYSCPICMFTLPSKCAIQGHLRIHKKTPPYYCPECGLNIPNKVLNTITASHNCEGFKMMRLTRRIECPIDRIRCGIFNPSELKNHIKSVHLKKVFKCVLCAFICYNEIEMNEHTKNHSTYNNTCKFSVFYRCDGCEHAIIGEREIENHFKHHTNNKAVYPCFICDKIFSSLKLLIAHSNGVHKSVSYTTDVTTVTNSDVVYHVKENNICDSLQQTMHNLIRIAPKPNSSKDFSIHENNAKNQVKSNVSKSNIKCHLCKEKINENWINVKKHYAIHHKDVKYLDAKLELKRLDSRKIIKKNKINNTKIRNRPSKILKIKEKCEDETKHSNINKSNDEVAIASLNTVNNNHDCNNTNNASKQKALVSAMIESKHEYVCKCKTKFYNEGMFQAHLLTHRDPYSAYQCMNCGECFVVKPSFATHLLLEHSIQDVERYINTKQCYNENALSKYLDSSSVSNEPIRENQCKICREQFDDSVNLEKHFRVHGMAFLLKNTTKNNIKS